MLTFIGLGLSDEQDISVKGLEAVRAADRVYLECHTSRLTGTTLGAMQEFYGRPVIPLTREEMEVRPGEILALCEGTRRGPPLRRGPHGLHDPRRPQAEGEGRGGGDPDHPRGVHPDARSRASPASRITGSGSPPPSPFRLVPGSRPPPSRRSSRTSPSTSTRSSTSISRRDGS